MNKKRYFISKHDLNFLNDVYEYLQTTNLGKCSDFDTKFKNLLIKFSKIKEIQEFERNLR